MSRRAADSAPGRTAPARAGAVALWCLFTTTSLLAGAVLSGASAPQAVPPGIVRPFPPARYADGAPPGFSGGFGEQSCHACHFHADVNTGPGRVAIAGVPERFVPGTSYPLTITLSRPGMVMGGFQFTARLENGGAQAGTLAAGPGEEERIAVEVQDAVEYASQRRPGTALVAPDTARWSLLWTAPQASARVLFHVAANAADEDESVHGDFVHTAVVASEPAEP